MDTHVRNAAIVDVPLETAEPKVLALSPADHHFLAQLALERPLTVDLEREVRLTAEGLIERRFGQLVLTAAGRDLLGLGASPH